MALKSALKEALSDPDVVTHSKQWPWTPGQNLLLYEDPDYHFVINATVQKPGSKGAVHDHGHSWTLQRLSMALSVSSGIRAWMTASASDLPISSS